MTERDETITPAMIEAAKDVARMCRRLHAQGVLMPDSDFLRALYLAMRRAKLRESN